MDFRAIVLLATTILAAAQSASCARTENPGGVSGRDRVIQESTTHPTPFVLEDRAAAVDRDTLNADLAAGEEATRTFFGASLRAPVVVVIADSRESFTASFPKEWGMTTTECWMVAAGVADKLIMLAPKRWKTAACDHDPSDRQQVRDIVVHELVHVFHGQNNPTKDFTGADDIGWFIEGLAVHVSGQLHHGHLAEAREAVTAGVGPTKLKDAWSGKHRYGVAGSLVEFIDRTYGRDRIRSLLKQTNQKGILEDLGVSEDALLVAWREYVRQSPSS